LELDNPCLAGLLKYSKALTIALGYRDLSTRLHSERVHGLSHEIGLACGLSSSELGILQVAASFHDIGKIGIPDQILKKPSKLDEHEREIMKQHPEIGQQIMAATDLDSAPQASLIIRQHHENFDGSGYPDGLAGEAIRICARIIGIADSYDAMAVTRAYHHARKHAEIIAVMDRESGAKHDPSVMRHFHQVIASSRFKVA
jgi:response regulator RpfG family c-di-GMP phosphodiesterase